MGLAACHWVPAETGSDGMVGLVRDASGAPVVGQQIDTLEAQARTDADGRFAVSYKPPNTEIHFLRGAVFYQRAWTPADPAVVAVTLPAQREAELVCGELACDVTLTWSLAAGFDARVAARCEPERSLALGEIPVGTPAMTCRAGLGDPDVSTPLEDRGAVLLAVAPPHALTVRVPGAADCDVAVDGRPAVVRPDGSFGAEARGLVTVTADCGGRPARPAVVAASVGEVALAWTADGPWVAIPGAVGEMEIQCRDADGSWTATWRSGPDGVFRLPRLEPGRCDVVLAAPELRPTAWAADLPDPGPDTMLVREVVPGAFKGRLKVTSNLEAGQIRVVR